MLEYWNDGILGSGKLGFWFIRKIHLNMIGNMSKNENSPLIPLLAGPLFHHSIIPCAGQKHQAPKNSLIFPPLRDTDSEMFNCTGFIA
jgi:hypothetical protein